MVKKLEPITPGEILLEEFMRPYGISQNKLARDLDIPIARVNDIIHAKRSVTPDTAFRFGTYFKTSPEFWLNLQTAYDVKLTEQKSGSRLRAIIRPLEEIEIRV
jgi:addiction module HigA family antidote